jgi:ABC-type dipeptide/oligopeptide/nickel transport system ATPase subunit
MIFQDAMSSFNPTITVGEQIAEAVEVQRRARANPRSTRSRTQGYGLAQYFVDGLLPTRDFTDRESHERAIELLAQVGIPDPAQRAEEYPHQFSGGMLQRAMVAQALAGEPDLLIADEPTTALDVTIQAQILNLLERVQAEEGMSVLLITHDLGVVARTCDRVGVMYAGEVVERGTLADLFDDAVAHAIQRVSRGLIRRINIIADKTLLAAYSEGTTLLKPRHVRTAARDSRFTEASRFGRWTPWVAGGGGIAVGLLLAGLTAWWLWPSGGRTVAPTENTASAEQSARAEVEAPKPGDEGPSSTGSAETGTDEAPEPDPRATEQAFEAERSEAARGVRLTGASSGTGARAGASASNPALLEKRLADTRRWLLNAESGQYSIQLMMLGTGSAGNLNDYLKELPNTIDLNDIFVYETVIDGEPMFGVLYRRFDSRDAARDQMRDMPAPFRTIEPFLLRSVRGLRNEITDRNS